MFIFDLPFVEQIDFSVLRHFVFGPAIVFLLTRPKQFMSRDHVLLTADPLINGQRSFQCTTDILLADFQNKTTFRSCRQTDAKLKSPLDTRQQILHVLCGQLCKKPPVSCKHAAKTVIQLFELNSEDAKSDNLHCGPIQSLKTVPSKFRITGFCHVLLY